MKPLQIGLLVVAGALGGAVFMKYSQRPHAAPPETPTAAQAQAPPPAPVAPPVEPAAPPPAAVQPAPGGRKAQPGRAGEDAAAPGRKPANPGTSRPPGASRCMLHGIQRRLYRLLLRTA